MGKANCGSLCSKQSKVHTEEEGEGEKVCHQKMTQPIEAARHFSMASCHEAYVVVVTLFFGTGTESPNL